METNSTANNNTGWTRLCYEFVAIRHDFLYALSLLHTGDKGALIFAATMVLGVFLPWISVPGLPTQTGVMGGGDAHLLLAAYAFYLIKQIPRIYRKAMSKKRHRLLLSFRLRRISFGYFFIGASSTLVAIFILLYFGSQYQTLGREIDVRFGFYLTLFSGVSIFFCGLERFIRN